MAAWSRGQPAPETRLWRHGPANNRQPKRPHGGTVPRSIRRGAAPYQPRISANISGATMVASDSMMNFGVSADSLPQVIFSFGTAPE